MTLPRNIARCRGDGADECQSCARRIAAQAEMGGGWPIWAVWMAPPISRPCSRRIEVQQEEA